MDCTEKHISSSNCKEEVCKGITEEKYSLTDYYEKLQSLEKNLEESRQSLCNLKTNVQTVKEIVNMQDFEHLQSQISKPLDKTQVISFDSPERFVDLVHLSSKIISNFKNNTMDISCKHLINGLKEVTDMVEATHHQALEIENSMQS